MKKVPQQQTPPPQVEMSRNDFRLMVAKEKMLNGKNFEDCTRMELFEMLMSLIKQIREMHIEKKKAEDAKLKNRIKAWWKNLKAKITAKLKTKQSA
jgi:hypothetical protein